MSKMENRTVWPLNDSQRGVYFECAEKPQSTMYNIVIAMALPAETDLDRFEGAVRTAIAVHPALAATISADGGEPVMVGGDPAALVVRRTAAASRAEARAKYPQPFDLEKGPLARFDICQTPEGADFIFEISHLVFDGTSTKLLVDQIAAAYGGEAPQAEQLDLEAFAAAEAALPESPEWAEARDFFASRFDGIECDTQLISDTGVSNPSDDEGVLQLPSPESINVERISAFARSKGITPNILFTSAFATTLAAFAGAKESYFTCASAGRRLPGLETTVGMFVRSLPLRISIPENAAADDFLAEVRDIFSKTRQYEFYPFGELVREYGINSDISFVYQSGLMAGAPIAGSNVKVEYLPPRQCQQNLICMMMKGKSSYTLELHYRRDLYTEDLLKSFCDTLWTVVEGLVAGQPLGELALCSGRCRARIDAFNSTESSLLPPRTVQERFEAVLATVDPQKPAVVTMNQTYTYADLDRISGWIADYIADLGIGREDFVAVLVPRCEWMVLASWGVVRACAAFQPLDPTYPQERLEYMVSDSGARLLIADRALRPLLTSYDGPVLYTDDILSRSLAQNQSQTAPKTRSLAQEPLQTAPKTRSLERPEPTDALTMIYTSGTTGKPKGCILENRNIAAFWRNHTVCFGLGESSRLASYASYGFDAGVMDVMTTPMSGATICIVPDEIRLDLPEIEKFYIDNRITHGFMTTQLGRMFAQQTECPTLEAFLVGGEKLVPFQPSGAFRFINGYGPCETMAYICAHEVTDASLVQPIGRPHLDIKLYVVDPHLRLLPEGAVGELCISGCQVGRGYLGLPEKTASVFVPNPFDGEKEGYSRMYRSGDIVRLLPQGEIEFIGRRDGQVKVRGFRIELTEVEEVIRRYEGITDATVAAFDDPAGGKFIAAYVVSPAPVDTAALAAFIRSEKPAYMVPAVTMQIDAIPYNQNQKVNRRALPEPVRQAVEVVAPRSEAETKVYDLAKEVLGHDAFGVTTDLFEAGMTSLGLLRFNSLLAKEFNKAVKISDLKALQTVEAIAAFVLGGEQATVWELQKDYPLMQNQMGVFVESSMNPSGLDYNIPLLMEVSGEIDPEALRSAASAAIDAHPYLKTMLASDIEGRIRAVRRDDAAPEVGLVEVPALPAALDLVRPFELLGAPLYRAAVYVTPEANYLFFDIHHIIGDGFSVAILLRDIDRALAGEALQKEAYTGFEAGLDEEQLRSGEKLPAAEAYFDALLGGCNTECLPAKCPVGGAAPAGHLSRLLSEDVSGAAAFCARNNLTLNAFFNAAFSLTLGAFIHSDELTYCTVYNGRNDSRLSESFAMLVKTFPVCVTINNDSSALDFIRSVQNQLVDTMSSDAMSFAEIASKFGLKSDIFFNYQGDNFVFDSLGGKPARVIELETGVAKAPLCFEVFLEDGVFRVSADWRGDLFRRELVESMVSALETAAASLMTAEKLSDVQFMAASERALFDRMNATGQPFELVPAQTFFCRHAAANPDKVAVKTASACLTYRQLDEMSTRLASALLKKGAKDNEIVAMILDRTEYIPVAELGIMKAGCAFLPMLPSYPKDRIDFCMKDASVRFVVNDENIRQLVAEGDLQLPEVPFHGSDLAYCIYTSGSTGTPKGVMLEQHNLTNYVQTAGLNALLDKGSTILCMASISFDLSLSEIFSALSRGKTLYIASEEEIHNLDKLYDAFVKEGVDMMAMTPSFCWSLMSLPEFNDALAQLQAIMLAAEAFQPQLLSRLKGLNPDMLVLNGYGPTETTQGCSFKTLDVGDTVTIGGPVANCKYYVADERCRLLPRYAVGELIICGENVCRGYVGLPEKNAASFFEIDGVRAYHSGDLVRINADLEAEFGGRKDNQVKLRGFRVELDEVEAVMESYPGLTRAKVVVRNNGSEDFLAGFFTADKQIAVDELTAFMKTKLTNYMVPAAMMQLDRMPMTQGGKLDKKALPEIKPAARVRAARKAPKKSLEESILEEFKAVLGIEDCFVDDNFFEIGGTSLSASKVVMRIKAAGHKVEYQDIFDHQTAEELAEYLEGIEGAKKTSEAAPVKEDENQLVHEESFTREILSHNKLEFAGEVVREGLGDVVLTGATGFLGCHILYELIKRESGKIYCLMRRGHFEDVRDRLKSMLFYYFEDDFAELFGERLFCVEGDITADNLGEILAPVQFNTVINCAACVKHFANDNSIEFVNVHGVENIIKVCKAHSARMIQISTTSIPGAHTDETYRSRVVMHEDRVFVVDDMNNQYVQSKYKAELLIFKAIGEGLSAKVIRVGNLMGRHRDGEFQANMRTNAFLNGLRGFTAIGKCPISHATDPMGFSPIDCTAAAVVLLAGTNDCFTAFHADNRWSFDEMKLMEAVNRCGLPVIPVPDKEYYADFYAMMADPEKNARVSALLTNDRPDLHLVNTDNTFTSNILYRLGFSWPFVDDSYLDRVITALKTLGFFDL